MGFLNSVIILFLCPVPAILQTVHGTDLPVRHTCSNTKHKSNGRFVPNKDKLIAWLPSAASVRGFAGKSWGQDSDQVHGIGICTANVTTQNCRACLEKASLEIRKLCPRQETAVIWFDDCMLKYSSNKFFGSIDNRNKFHQCNKLSVSKHRYQYTGTRFSMLELDIYYAAFKSPNLYAAKIIQIGHRNVRYTMYTYSQCTRDLSPFRCYLCLRLVSGRVRRSCFRRLGGQAYSGSCGVRYELHPFVNS